MAGIFGFRNKENKERDYDYQKDTAITSSKEDKFAHGDYVDILKDILLNSKPPLNVGLYGRWGVGKSSILNLLEYEIENNNELTNFKYVYLDAWGWSKNSLPQEILIGVNEKLDTFELTEIEDKLYNVTEEDISVRSHNWKTTSPFLKCNWKTILPIIIFLGIGIACILTLQLFIDLVTSVLLGTIIAILPSGISMLSTLMKFTAKQSKRIIPKAASSYKFNEMYKKMIDKQGITFVVVIDNLDRCEDKVAVELLGIIQTFMTKNNCINILACDDEAIVNHLTRVKGEFYTKSEGNEFLSKFFQVTLVIPPFIGKNLEEYTKNMISKRNINLDSSARHVLVSGAIKNPRKINQFLNNIVAMYRLAEIRETNDRLDKGSITGNTGFLTKIVIIKHEWPMFYKQLEEDNSLWYKIDEDITIDKFQELLPPENKEIKKEFNEKGLKQFLNYTYYCNTYNISPFLKLNQESFEGSIHDKDAFVLAVNGRDMEKINSIFDKLSPDNKKDYIQKIISLNDQHENENAIDVLINSTRVLLDLEEKIDDVSLKEDIFLSLGTHLRRTLSEHSQAYDLPKIFTKLEKIPDRYRNTIIEKLSGLVMDEKGQINFVVLEYLIDFSTMISNDILEKINSALLTISVESHDEIIEFVKTKCGSDDWVDNKFPKPFSLLCKLIDILIFDNSESDNKTIDVILSTQTKIHESEYEYFFQHILKKISTRCYAY